jgi:hypothetical protein
MIDEMIDEMIERPWTSGRVALPGRIEGPGTLPAES